MELLFENMSSTFQMIVPMVVILMVFYTCGEIVLRGVGPIIRNGQRLPSEVFYILCSNFYVLRNFGKFPAKHLCIEKHFPVHFAKFLKKPSLQNISGQLLLNGYGIQRQHYVALLHESEMLTMLHSRNLILSTNPRFHLFVFNVNQANEKAG